MENADRWAETPLSKLGMKILLDRYALKGGGNLEEGALVVYRKDKGGVEIGTVVSVNPDWVTLDIDGEIIKCASKNIETLLETHPEQVIERVVTAIANVEQEGADREKWRENFSWLMRDWNFVPAGRILAASGGKGLRTPYNCFVLPSPGDSRGEIIATLTQLIEIMAHGGGVGINISTLRPRNARVSTVNGRSSGPTSWGELYSEAVHLVEQGGSRRGALVLVLNDWHPDILEFINGKRNNGKLSGANISVGISERFMQAVQEDYDWDLVFPDTTDPDYDNLWDGDIEAWKAEKPIIRYKTVKARAIWGAIIESAWASAEPGVLFLDRYNEMSNSFYFSAIMAANPCGEQGLPYWGVCNLGSLNLPKFIDDKGVNWVRLRMAVRYAVRFLDNVIDHSHCVFDEVSKVQHAQRRIGLGTMGLAEMLIRLKIRYGSPECLDFLHELYRFIACEAYLASADYAEEKGSFPKFEAEFFLNSGYMKVMPKNIITAVREKGVRNVSILSQAPTGTIATMVGTSTGIEPFYSWEFHTTNRLGTHTVTTDVAVEWQEANPEQSLPCYFVTAQQLPPKKHARVQGVVQRWIDAGVSKTVNMPKGSTVEHVAEVYRLMYDLGCKGGTVYIDGTIKDQPLSTKKEFEIEVDAHLPRLPLKNKVVETPKVRPIKLKGNTYRKKTPVGTAYITTNVGADDEPFEVFINVGKAGSDVAAVAEGLGRLISLILRLQGSTTSRDRVRDIVGQLRGIGSGRAQGFGKQRVMSLPDAVAQALAEAGGFDTAGQLPGLPDVEDARVEVRRVGDLCPECGQSALVFEEGCKKCYSCGFSEC